MVGIITFKDTLSEEWKNTTVIVISEFGRTVKENGNKISENNQKK